MHIRSFTFSRSIGSDELPIYDRRAKKGIYDNHAEQETFILLLRSISKGGNMEYKRYVEIICPYCKNRNGNKCNIVRRIDGTIHCVEYELDRECLLEEYAKRDDLKYDIQRNTRNRQIIQKREMEKAKKTENSTRSSM